MPKQVGLLMMISYLITGIPAWGEAPSNMVLIPGGVYQLRGTTGSVLVRDFYLDKYPVTQVQYLDFVKKNPTWRKSQAKRIFADSFYLMNWEGDLKLKSTASRNMPVTYVSWFAARAYCVARGKSLPTLDQWEYVSDPRFFRLKQNQNLNDQILKWYGKPAMDSLAPVGSGLVNRYGVYDLHGLIWEWVEDFNTVTLKDESRKYYCGGGSLDSSNVKDYVGFMRFAFRSSLKASYTTGQLGFRCVQESQ